MTLKSKHHTVADWDFERGANARSLDPTFYISAPTSLHFTADPVLGTNVILCRIPETLCLPQGELRTWLRRGNDNASISLGTFRNQAALGGAGIANCYFVYLYPNRLVCYRSVNFVYKDLGTWFSATAHSTWYHFRLVWYNGLTPAEQPALCVDLYKEVDGEWIRQSSTKYDTDNLWKDSEINRCGPYCYVGANRYSWFDDTEIWGPV